MASTTAYSIIGTLGLISAAIIATIKVRKYNKAQRKLYERLDRKISVDLVTAEIVSGTRMHDSDDDNTSSTEAFDRISQYNPDRYLSPNIEVCQVVANGKLPDGRPRKFVSQTIEISPVTLRYKLDQKKSTDVFYSSQNPTECRFDLSFLIDEHEQ